MLHVAIRQASPIALDASFSCRNGETLVLVGPSGSGKSTILKTIAGIYAIRCKASPEIWVGQAPNLEKIQNRIWFSLRQGSHTCRSLQAA